MGRFPKFWVIFLRKSLHLSQILGMILFKVIDLETEISALYEGRGFRLSIDVSEKTFLNRWKTKKTVGIVFKNRYYIKQVEVKCR